MSFSSPHSSQLCVSRNEPNPVAGFLLSSVTNHVSNISPADSPRKEWGDAPPTAPGRRSNSQPWIARRFTKKVPVVGHLNSDFWCLDWMTVYLLQNHNPWCQTGVVIMSGCFILVLPVDHSSPALSFSCTLLQLFTLARR